MQFPKCAGYSVPFSKSTVFKICLQKNVPFSCEWEANPSSFSPFCKCAGIALTQSYIAFDASFQNNTPKYLSSPKCDSQRLNLEEGTYFLSSINHMPMYTSFKTFLAPICHSEIQYKSIL